MIEVLVWCLRFNDVNLTLHPFEDFLNLSNKFIFMFIDGGLTFHPWHSEGLQVELRLPYLRPIVFQVGCGYVARRQTTTGP